MSWSLVSLEYEDEMRALHAPARWLTVLTPLMVMACGFESTEPVGVEFQVIEEISFAASLGIDLSAMQIVGTGVYILDVTVGEGEELVSGDQPLVSYQGWLSNGTGFDSGSFAFLIGGDEVIPGFEQGILGMKVGGVRRMIIPPALAYGAQGTGPVPPGAVLIFEVEILEVASGS